MTRILHPMLARAVLACALAGVAAPSGTSPPADQPQKAELEADFRLLYNLQFDAAEKGFQEYQQRHPADPLGFAAEGSALAFEEFYRLGLLRSSNFLGLRGLEGKPAKPDERRRELFFSTQTRGRSLAEQRLAKDPRDQDAWFALVLSNGLGADYSYLVERRGWEALKYTHNADREAKRLIALNPAYYDAYLSVGAANYIASSLPAPQRLALRLAGVVADKQRGFKLLELVAERGQLLKPFAKILLALAYLREGELARSRQLLVELEREFPDNSIFPRELAMLDARRPAGSRQ